MNASEFDKHPELGDNFWGEDGRYSVSAWQTEVENNDTRLGYWDWVVAQREQEEDRYNSVGSLAFIIHHRKEAPTAAEIRDAVLRRVKGLGVPDEWHEAVEVSDTRDEEEEDAP